MSDFCLRVLQIRPYDQRLVKKDIFAFGIANSMKVPILDRIALIPIKSDTVLDSLRHTNVYYCNIRALYRQPWLNARSRRNLDSRIHFANCFESKQNRAAH